MMCSKEQGFAAGLSVHPHHHQRLLLQLLPTVDAEWFTVMLGLSVLLLF